MQEQAGSKGQILFPDLPKWTNIPVGSCDAIEGTKGRSGMMNDKQYVDARYFFF